MPTFNQFKNDNGEVTSQNITYDFSDKQSKGTFLTRVFGMMFVLLLITTVVAAGLGYGSQYFLEQAVNAGNETLTANIVFGLTVTLIVSVIALLVMSFVLPITFIRGRHNIIVPLMIYVVLMGIMLSTFTFLFDWVILVEAFGITTVIFGVMALLGYISKGRLAGIGFILLGLIIGAAALSLVNYFMILIGGVSEQSVTLSWIVSLMIFGFLMLVTLYDVYRIKRIAEAGMDTNNNLVYYCAFILFTDFISILIRVIYYLAIFTRRR